MAGDFYVLLNTDNDKLGGNSELHKMPRNIILNNIENLKLTDIWYHLHPQEKQFYIFQAKTQKCFFKTRLFHNFWWHDWPDKKEYNYSSFQNWSFKCWIYI